MRALFVGDSHGNRSFMSQAVRLAERFEAPVIIQLGDFGWWPTGHGYVAHVRRLAKRSGVKVLAIDGNHDFAGDGRRDDAGYLGYSVSLDDRHRFDLDDLTVDLHHLPRGARTRIGGVEFGFCGGAVSIDRDARAHGRDWWPYEMLTDDDVARCIAGGPLDVLISHDAIDLPPGGKDYRISGPLTTDLMIQRSLLRQVVRETRPALRVHGHLHHRYALEDHYGRVVGLGYEGSAAWLFWDTDNGPDWLTDHGPKAWWLDALPADRRSVALAELDEIDDPVAHTAACLRWAQAVTVLAQ
jgi:predicted phosphodiesterase